MTILLLKGYNNYFNRIVKQEASITAYKQASTSYLEYPTVNFNPNDGIATTLVVGGDTQKIETIVNNQTTTKILDFEDGGSPDYLIVHDNTNIKSRWFIVECVRVRAGQYQLALKRDVLVDFYSQVMNSPCFVEKGSINDVYSPLLLNSEGMRFNQIKQSEDFIKDSSRCAWLVGYVKKDIDASDLTNVNPISYTSPGASANIPAAGSYDWEPCIQYYDTTGTVVNSSPKTCFYFYNSDISFRLWYQPDYFSLFVGNIRCKFTENYQMLYNSADYPHEN